MNIDNYFKINNDTQNVSYEILGNLIKFTVFPPNGLNQFPMYFYFTNGPRFLCQ